MNQDRLSLYEGEKVNSVQRESAAKYLYDLSKGFLLTGVAGMLADKITVLSLVLALIVASFTFNMAFDLERD